MDQSSENHSSQQQPETAASSTALGKTLREAREALGLSIGDVATQIKFAPRQIEALEAGDYKHLPELAFLRGFVRSYARILQLDAETLLEALPQKPAVVSELSPVPVGMPYPVPHNPQKQNLILLGAALFLAVVVVGFAVWHFTNPVAKPPKVAKVETPIALPAEQPAFAIVKPVEQTGQSVRNETLQKTEQKPGAQQKADKQPEKPKDKPKGESKADKPKGESGTDNLKAERKQKIETAPAPVPQSAAMPVMQSAVTGEKSVADKPLLSAKAASQVPAVNVSGATSVTRIRLVFGEESWTEVTGKEGKVLSSRMHPAGSEFNLKGTMPLVLVIGHAASAKLYQDGQQIDLTPYINSSSEVARLKLE